MRRPSSTLNPERRTCHRLGTGFYPRTAETQGALDLGHDLKLRWPEINRSPRTHERVEVEAPAAPKRHVRHIDWSTASHERGRSNLKSNDLRTRGTVDGVEYASAVEVECGQSSRRDDHSGAKHPEHLIGDKEKYHYENPGHNREDP